MKRTLEEGKQIVGGKFPAVLSLTKDYGEPRYPSFIGIRKAQRAQFPTWSLIDLDMEPPTSVVSWTDVRVPPQQEIINEIIEGETPKEKAKKLVERITEEKVL